MADVAEISEKLNTMAIEKKAVKVRIDWVPEKYEEVVDESILNIKFTPDFFQKQAFYFLSKGDSIFVSAHTSSGKTLVAEYAIALSIKNGSRVIYTSPIKALSNQKFYDFKQKFPDVGLITGDVQVNPDAKCLIMTTEILRNMIYKNSDILRDTEFVIFDEVHYINDPDRGVVWEECIIMLQSHISLVMLSATIPNALEFAEWVGRTKNRCIYVISTTHRAVPLEFAIYCDGDVFAINESNPKSEIPQITNFKNPLTPFSKKVKISNRFRVNDLGNFVNNKRLVPAIFFTFSKKMCEEYGQSLQLLDLTTPAEKKLILKFLDEAMLHLREEDRNLPQIKTMREQAYCGIAIHHGALLPFVKECVEILFSENLIKILVATETFAMGVNMPAKCCAFLGLTKINNGRFRFLHTGEFIQMSGRAGRRGMDKVGTVIIADPKSPSLADIKKVLSGIPHNLSSQFKLSFSLILQALRSNVEVEDLMRNSFREHSAQKDFHSDMLKLSKLESTKLLSCENCSSFTDFFAKMAFVLKEMPFILKKYAKVGDTILTKSNSTVKIDSIHQSEITVSPVSDVNLKSLFYQKIDENIEKQYANNQSKSKFQYPLCFFSQSNKKIINFDDCAALIKNNEISFEFDESEINFVFKIAEIKKAWKAIENSSLFSCPDHAIHYLLAIDSRNIVEQIEYIKNKYSVESLIQMNEYKARTEFLKKHNFISDSITLKGRVSAEIRTVNDVLVTEMIFNNEFEEFTPSELISVFSAMINEEAVEEFDISPELKDKVSIIERYFDHLSRDLDLLNIPPFEPLDISMVQPVFDWCSGLSLGNIVARHKIPEGSFVRLLLRLDECCREMINVSNIIGNTLLLEKFEQASNIIKRDIVFMPSLYI